MTMTIEQAATWIADVLQARVDDVSEHPEGGWMFEAAGIAAYGSTLIENHDVFDYCLLDTENDEEIGRHNETVMFMRLDPATNLTLLLEGHYSRPLGDARDDADARITGRIALVRADQVHSMRQSFANGFSDRTLEAQLTSLGYASSALRTVIHYRHEAVPQDLRLRLMKEIGEMNRVVLELLEMNDAA